MAHIGMKYPVAQHGQRETNMQMDLFLQRQLTLQEPQIKMMLIFGRTME